MSEETLLKSLNKDNEVPEIDGRKLNVLPDAPDIRDRIYEPALLDLVLKLDAPGMHISPVRDQGREGSCTGFALASAINLMNNKRYGTEEGHSPMMASPRMLYEMAKIHDEWPGEDYQGSSIRGALKGFFHNGVCREQLALYRDGERNWSLNKDQAEDARNTGLGAYYRLRPSITDYHAALNETGVVYVSARIHSGWYRPDRHGEIKRSTRQEGGHAFIIVGYDETGFLIQNSWGPDWSRFDGQPGIARWLYEDWAETVMDAWVLRLSVPTPDAFDLTRPDSSSGTAAVFGDASSASPKRNEVIGHVIHLDDGELVEKGRYGTPMPVIQETADFLADEEATAGRDYQHLLFYAHGGLNGEKASANRIKKMKEVFKRNRIYPIHFMWETGFFNTLWDILGASAARSQERVGGFTDASDWLIEFATRKGGRAIWRDMKGDAERSFKASGGGSKALAALLKGNAKRSKPLKIHIVGHSAGSIFLAEMLNRMTAANPLKTPVTSCCLMAPACTVDLFERHYRKRIGKKGSADGIAKMVQYNLIDQRELDDSVGPYRKSLLYFVSRAFEEERKAKLLGMEIGLDDLSKPITHDLHYAGRGASITDSKTHGGFDNDRATMNHILATVTGKKPSQKKGFQESDLTGY